MAAWILSPWAIAFKVALPMAVGFAHLSRPIELVRINHLLTVATIYVSVLAWNSHLLAIRLR